MAGHVVALQCVRNYITKLNVLMQKVFSLTKLKNFP